MPKLSKGYLYLLIFCIAAPISFVLIQAFSSQELNDQESWKFLLDNTVFDLLKSTASLSLLTVLLSCLIGYAQAIIIHFTNLYMKKIFHILFLLPIVFPIYILSYVYVGSFEYSGDIPTFFRSYLNFNLTTALPIKSVMGVSLVFSFALAPYVYLFIKSAFLRMDAKLILSARSLGQSSFYILRKLILPYSKPWLYSSGILVFLEVLCDFGGVSVFNYDTFSTAIYHAWISFFSINTAIKLSSFPLIFAVILYCFNQWLSKEVPVKRKANTPFLLFRLSKQARLSLTLLSLTYCFFSALFPIGKLLYWSLEGLKKEMDVENLKLILQTLTIGIVVAILITIIAFILVFFARMFYSKKDRQLIILSKIGYAIPGSIIAISIISILSVAKINFFGFFAIGALFLGYLIRFLTPALEIQQKSYATISKKFDWISRSLGKGSSAILTQVHIPMLGPILIYSVVMIFLEVIKEMPITLILRPYGVNTLATKIFELTSEGEWERASVYGSVLIFFGFISLLISEFYNNKVGK